MSSFTNAQEVTMNIKRLLKDFAYQNLALGFEDAFALGQYALYGCEGDSESHRLAQFQSIAALCALHTKATYQSDLASQQIAGICAAVFIEDIGKSKFGFLKPNIDYAMDNCGMGGDLIVTANVSTTAALIAATADIPMCKHGSPANADQGRHGSSDFVSLLGISTTSDKDSVEQCLEETSFAYTEALDTRYKKIHMQTHKIAMLPHMNDIIGPITNPLDPSILSRRVLGANHLISPRVLAEAYSTLNSRDITNLRHGLFVRGFGDDTETGMDEVSLCLMGTQVVELRDGEILEYHLSAESFGLEPVPAWSISPPAGMSKGDFSLSILRGEVSGPPLQMVLANAALLFYLAGHSHNLRDCYQIAKEVHESGRPFEKVMEVKKHLPVADDVSLETADVDS